MDRLEAWTGRRFAGYTIRKQLPKRVVETTFVNLPRRRAMKLNTTFFNQVVRFTDEWDLFSEYLLTSCQRAKDGPQSSIPHRSPFQTHTHRFRKREVDPLEPLALEIEPFPQFCSSCFLVSRKSKLLINQSRLCMPSQNHQPVYLPGKRMSAMKTRKYIDLALLQIPVNNILFVEVVHPQRDFKNLWI